MDYEDLNYFSYLFIFIAAGAGMRSRLMRCYKKCLLPLRQGRMGSCELFPADNRSEYRPYGNVLLDECRQEQ